MPIRRRDSVGLYCSAGLLAIGDVLEGDSPDGMLAEKNA